MRATASTSATAKQPIFGHCDVVGLSQPLRAAYASAARIAAIAACAAYMQSWVGYTLLSATNTCMSVAHIICKAAGTSCCSPLAHMQRQWHNLQYVAHAWLRELGTHCATCTQSWVGYTLQSATNACMCVAHIICEALDTVWCLSHAHKHAHLS